MAIIERSEAAGYYFRYIDLVLESDICRVLEDQLLETMTLLRSITDQQSLFRYEAGKWNIREVVTHLSDTERVFAFRAFWFARGFDSALPSFDQNVAIAAAGAGERSWESVIEEFHTVRAASVTLFRSLPGDAWQRCGIASGNPFSVRALAHLAAGHVMHHSAILRERYLSRRGREL